MIPKELDDGLEVGTPVLGPAFEVHEHGGEPGRVEQRDRVFEILVEVGVEDALVHEVEPRADVEQDPSQVVQLERREHAGVRGHRLLDGGAVLANHLLLPGFDLGDHGEAVAGGSPREYRTKSSLSELEVSFLGNRLRRRLAPIRLGHPAPPFECERPHR